jgi:hypothetical protein
MRGCATAGQVVFSSRIGQERKAMIKTQPRFCLILQRKAKRGVCASQCGKRSLSDYLIFGSFYQEKEQIKPQRPAVEEIGNEHYIARYLIAQGLPRRCAHTALLAPRNDVSVRVRPAQTQLQTPSQNLPVLFCR